jgi:hypothetical protein
VIVALCSLQNTTIPWLNHEEKQRIISLIERKHRFPLIVGIMNGILISLAFGPTMQGEDYSSRKMNYGLVVLIIITIHANFYMYVQVI